MAEWIELEEAAGIVSAQTGVSESQAEHMIQRALERGAIVERGGRGTIRTFPGGVTVVTEAAGHGWGISRESLQTWINDLSGSRKPPRRRAKGGRKEVADWDAVKEALRQKIQADGWPEKLNVAGWQKKADVKKWVADLLSQRDNVTPGETTIRDHVNAMLEEIEREEGAKT